MASNYTEHYGLCQWEAADQVLRTDFNEDNAKIEEALNAFAEQNVAMEAAVAALGEAAGNCEMELITYTGTGSYGEGKPTKVTFSSVPDVFLAAGDQSLYFGRGGTTSGIIASEDFINNVTCSWSGNQLSMINYVAARYQMNSKSKPYWVLGLKRK